MISVRIRKIGEFMKELLSADSFDGFCLEKAVIRTEVTYEIDGRVSAAFREENTSDIPYIPWQKIRPRLYDILKGKQTPENIRLVFQAGEALKQSLFRTLTDNDYLLPVHAFILNVLYDRDTLKLISAVSYDDFTLEKEAEKLWDAAVISMLDRLGFDYADS